MAKDGESQLDGIRTNRGVLQMVHEIRSLRPIGKMVGRIVMGDSLV